MKRFCALAVLMLFGSPAYAGNSFSFVIGGHHIHIEASRHCNSASCVSVSIPGVYEKRARRDRYDDEVRDAPPPAQPAPVAAPVAPPASPPPVQPVVCAPAAPLTRPVAPVAPQVIAQPQPRVQPPQIQPITTAAVPPPPLAPPAVAPPPPSPPAIARPAEAALPPMPAVAAPRISKVVHRVEEEPDSPLGDWQTEGHKGLVRIETCGQALCGYVLDPSTEAKGETVLIDMKSKTASEWSGNIYSRNSGNTYYATMTLKGPDSLQVEACALGRFFCSGNAWIRIAKPERLITYRQISTEPRS
ncbi:MAG TPA: DUF2147 domain-containing protein [Bradyrhizobium sp.]